MTTWLTLIGVFLLLTATVAGMRSFRRLVWRAPDRKIDELIKPPKRRFEGYDEAVRQRAAERREHSDYERRIAARWDSNPNVGPGDPIWREDRDAHRST